MSKNKFLINSYLMLLKSIDDEDKKTEIINKIELLLNDYEKDYIYGYEEDEEDEEEDEEIITKIKIYLDDKNYTSAKDIWVNCLNRRNETYTNRSAYRINNIIRNLPDWRYVCSVRITRKLEKGGTFNYHGKGYKKEMSL